MARVEKGLDQFATWWDRSIFNRPILFRPKLLYHITNLETWNNMKLQYTYDERTKKNPKKVNSVSGIDDKSIWFDTRLKESIQRTVGQWIKLKGQLIIIIINPKKVKNLRRNLFLRTKVALNTSYRGDSFWRRSSVMVKLKFFSGKKYGSWNNLTSDCQDEITLAQAKVKRL